MDVVERVKQAKKQAMHMEATVWTRHISMAVDKTTKVVEISCAK